MSKKKKLLYISPRDMRKNRADPVHIMMSCKAFVDNGWEVTLVTPRVKRKEYKEYKVNKNEIWKLYNLTSIFKIIELPTFFLTDGSNQNFSRTIKFVCFFFYYLFNIKSLRKETLVIYAKCYIGILPAILFKKIKLVKAKIIFEKAEFMRNNQYHKFINQNVDGIVAINQFIKENTTHHYKISPQNILKLPFATQTDFFVKRLSSNGKTVLHTTNKHYKIITYGGKIYNSSKEVNYILDSAKYLEGKFIKFVLIGGTGSAVSFWENYCKVHRYTNITFKGYQSLENFYRYIHASDILVSYYDSFDSLSVNQRVPAKLSVYLSACKPIILSDLPSMREWFDDDMVFYVKPDRPDLLADMIKYIISHPEEATIKANKCLEFAKNNTYQSAYRIVSEFIKDIG